MVLVAPAPPHRYPAGAPSAGESTAGRSTAGRSTAGESTSGESGNGREVLALLRGDTDARPLFDPGLAPGLRAWLEDAAYEASGGGEDGAPVLLGARHLLRLEDEEGPGGAADRPSVERLLHRLVLAVFRQIVHTGAVGDPLGDAVDALVAGGDVSVLEDVASLDEEDRASLSAALACHTRHLCALVPLFAPGWFPRTDDYVAIPLAGGRVVLHGVFDLLVGLPRPGVSSLCAVGVATGARNRGRRSLHYLALLETLRSGTPPFRMALLESSTGRYRVEDVREEHLRAMAAHIAARLPRGDIDG